MTWVLLLMGGLSGGPSFTIPGYTSKEQCEMDGQRLKKEIYNWSGSRYLCVEVQLQK